MHSWNGWWARLATLGLENLDDTERRDIHETGISVDVGDVIEGQQASGGALFAREEDVAEAGEGHSEAVV